MSERAAQRRKKKITTKMAEDTGLTEKETVKMFSDLIERWAKTNRGIQLQNEMNAQVYAEFTKNQKAMSSEVKGD